MPRGRSCHEEGRKPRDAYYMAPCPRCGQIVVHCSSGVLSMHRRSKKCRDQSKSSVQLAED